MQHPMEAAKRLSTVPLLSKVLRQTETVLGRRFRPKSDPSLYASLSGTDVEWLGGPHGSLRDGETTLGSQSQALQFKACNESTLCGGLECSIPGEGILGRARRRLVLLLFPGPKSKDLSQLAQEVPHFQSLDKTLVVSESYPQHDLSGQSPMPEVTGMHDCPWSKKLSCPVSNQVARSSLLPVAFSFQILSYVHALLRASGGPQALPPGSNLSC